MSKSNPPHKRPARFVIFGQDRSSGKTLAAQTLLSFAVHSDYNPVILQNDEQTRLLRYGAVRTVSFAGTNAVMNNEMIDMDNHGIVLELIKRLADDPKMIIAYDMAAGGVARVADIFDELDINGRLRAIGETALVVVPLTVRTDIAEGALFTINQFQAVLPDHLVKPMVSHRDGSPADLPLDHAFHRVLAAAQHGSLEFPAINKQTALLFERMSRTLHDVAGASGEVDLVSFAEELGTTEVRATLLVGTCRKILAGFKGQAESLGFQ